MPEPDPAKAKDTFASAKKLRQWLKANHASENELWIERYSK